MNCFYRYNSEYINGIKAFVTHLNQYNIAIIHSKECCETFAASSLSSEVKHLSNARPQTPSLITVRQFALTLVPLAVVNVKQILDSIKALSCTFIILICQCEVAQLIFTVAASYTSLSFGTIFVKLRLNMNAKFNPLPAQLIALNLELNDNYDFNRLHLNGKIQSWIISKVISKGKKEEHWSVEKNSSSLRYVLSNTGNK